MRTLPGAASTAVRYLVTSPARAGRVIGVHPTCVYVLTGARPGSADGSRAEEVVAVETADALRLPCAVRLGVDRSARPFAGVRPGDPALVGSGRVEAGSLCVPVARWWQPRTPRPCGEQVHTGRARAELARLLERHPCPVPVGGSVGDLLGLGPGLTPAGDDVLAGLLVALHRRDDLRAPLADEVSRLSPSRTTALSAALLRHAAAGTAVTAVLDLADALAGHGTDDGLVEALARLLMVGSSSGTALAHGLLRGARTVARTVENAA